MGRPKLKHMAAIQRSVPGVRGRREKHVGPVLMDELLRGGGEVDFI